MFDNPAMYRICVDGRIALSWSDRLAGMAIDVQEGPQRPPVTTLVGELADQAALMGVLKGLYEMQVSLLLVERLGAGQES